MSLRRLFCLLACFCVLPAAAQERLTVAVPGPYNIPYLPLDLAPKIGADRAEGFELSLRSVGGGGVALQQLQRRNVDFVVTGVPAAMSAKSRGHDVVVIGAVNDLTVYAMMVRADLKDAIKRPRDLAGRTLGVNSSSLTAKTASQQLAELILKNDGVAPEQVRIVATGQAWAEQAAAIRGRTVDAIMGNEPFASRLEETGEVFILVNIANPEHAANIPGAGFLHAALTTRPDVLRVAPERAEKMVAMLRRTLRWMTEHTPEQIVAALEIGDAATRASLQQALTRYPRLYSRDAKFSERQIAETDRFFAAAGGGGQHLRLGEMLDDRWAGRKP